MTREEAVMVTEEQAIKLNTIDDIILFLMECNRNGVNVYCIHNNEKLYSCDGYTYEEYYLLAMGIKPIDQKNIEKLIYGEDRSSQDCVNLSNLLTPVYSYLKEMYNPIREKLRQGKGIEK